MLLMAAFVGLTVLACVALIANRLLSHDDEQIEQRSVRQLNLLVIARYFGWTMLSAGIAYAVFLNSQRDHRDAAMMGYFVICYVIGLGAIVAGLQPTIAKRCPNCGYWGKTHYVGLRTAEGVAIEKQSDVPEGVTVYPTQEEECRHCGSVRGMTFW